MTCCVYCCHSHLHTKTHTHTHTHTQTQTQAHTHTHTRTHRHTHTHTHTHSKTALTHYTQIKSPASGPLYLPLPPSLLSTQILCIFIYFFIFMKSSLLSGFIWG